MGNRIAPETSLFENESGRGFPKDARTARRRSCRGYTLIELIVTMSVIGLVFFFTLPRIHRSFFADSHDPAALRIARTVDQLKKDASRTRVPHTLHLDVHGDRMWTTSENMNEQQREDAWAGSFELPGGSRILDVELPLKNRVDLDMARIDFHPGGFSDKAIINMRTGSEKRFALVVEPFLSKVRVIEND